MTTATTQQPDHNAPEIRVFHRPAGWTIPSLEPDPQDCTTNHTDQRKGMPTCTATAVWKVVELYDLHATFSFWCDDDLPAEYRPAATPAA